jgi:metal-dependent hydrolase (beta-lactamase superfamily II)
LGFLRKHLANAGIDAEEIDTVIFSHAHVDHVGGTLGWRARLSKCALSDHRSGMDFLDRRHRRYWITNG